MLAFPTGNKVIRAAGALLAVLSLGLPASAEGPVSINESRAMKAVVSKSEPEYPAMARQMRIVGTVAVAALVDEAGKVQKVSVISGNAILARACVSAVMQWKFTPFQSDGKTVQAEVQLSFRFSL